MHIHSCYLCYLLLACGLICQAGISQSSSLPYNGLRVALFDFKILKIKGKTVSVKCRVANTGREIAGGRKNVAETLIELDTPNIPVLLWGHESELASAVRPKLPRLSPGEISTPIWLKFSVNAPVEPDAAGCADLIIDTAYISRYYDSEAMLHYTLRNIGQAPIKVAGDDVMLGINLYFIGGGKLTRGAIPGGSTSVLLGRETLTGWLKAGQKLQGETLIDLKHRSKFAPNLLLELAPPPRMQECDRTNNTRALVLKF